MTKGETPETHLPERAQPREDAAPNPGAVLALGRREDLDAHVARGPVLDLGEQPIAEAPRQGRPARQQDVAEEGHAQVEVRAGDGVEDERREPRVLEPQQRGVEEDFGSAEALGPDL